MCLSYTMEVCPYIMWFLHWQVSSSFETYKFSHHLQFHTYYIWLLLHVVFSNKWMAMWRHYDAFKEVIFQWHFYASKVVSTHLWNTPRATFTKRLKRDFFHNWRFRGIAVFGCAISGCVETTFECCIRSHSGSPWAPLLGKQVVEPFRFGSNSWDRTILRILTQFWWLKPLGFSNGGYINTCCFIGSWNLRDKVSHTIHTRVSMEVSNDRS